MRSYTRGRPVTSLPKTIGISVLPSDQEADSRISLRQTGEGVLFGISIPTEPFPGTGARIRTE